MISTTPRMICAIPPMKSAIPWNTPLRDWTKALIIPVSKEITPVIKGTSISIISATRSIMGASASPMDLIISKIGGPNSDIIVSRISIKDSRIGCTVSHSAPKRLPRAFRKSSDVAASSTIPVVISPMGEVRALKTFESTPKAVDAPDMPADITPATLLMAEKPPATRLNTGAAALSAIKAVTIHISASPSEDSVP